MKILIVSNRYWPENFRITDIAESLVKIGHDVTVLTGLPNYPEGFIHEEYKKGKNRKEYKNGVKIIRVKEIGRRQNLFFRVLSYYSFPHNANRIVKELPDDFDIVLINGLSPIMSARPGLKYKKMHGTKVIMYGLDLWPASLLAGGIWKNGLVYKYYKNVSRKIYCECDKIFASTYEHIDYIKNLKGCSKLDIEFLPQYCEELFERKALKTIENDTIDILFAGNIGKAQSIDTIIKTADLLKNNKKYLFHIVGGGSELKKSKKKVEKFGLDNIIFYGQRSLEEMLEFYALADVVLVTLEDKPYANMTVPGKVQSYMATGKPLLGAVNGATAALIKKSESGVVVNAEDHEALAKAILELKKSDLEQYGKNARKYYLEYFSKEYFMNKLNESLTKLGSK